MKICARCKRERPEEEFNFKYKSRNIRSSHCRNCSRIYIKQHYLNNREYYLTKAKKRNKEIKIKVRTYLWEYLIKHPCVDCGESDPTVLEFDHTRDKLMNVSSFAREASLIKIKKEIEKCVIRCANCHRRKTAKTLGWHKYLK